MANCCGATRCTCRVTAGPGVTVDGNGSPGAPYVISSNGGTSEPTAIEAVDTPSVDVTVGGTGTAADPYEVSAAVILDATPPGGGSNLLHEGPDGLFVECADVRGCLSGGDGIDYDPATGIVAVTISGDAGNQTVIGVDGGIYTPSAATALEAVDTPTVDVAVDGTGTVGDPYQVSAAVIVDPTPPGGGSNLLQAGPDGLFVECADVRGCLSAGDGIDYDPATGVIAADISADAGNTTVIGSDGGIYTPPSATALQEADTPTVDVTITGTGAAGDPYQVAAAVILDPAPPGGGSNLLQEGPDGLFVECADVRGCITAGDGAAYTAGTGEVEARLSTDAGNQVAFGTDGGLFVPPDAPLEVGCGLQGDGTAATPLAAFPIAGSQPWTDDWDCDPAANSTLKCDPDSGALWTPPEHTSAAVTFQQNHPVTSPSFTGTGGFVLLDPNAWSEGTYTADSLSACRGISFSTEFNAHVEVTYTANAVFDLGYAVQIDGGALAVRIGHSWLQNPAAAGHERVSFEVSQAAVLPPHTGQAVRVWPAIRVTNGTVTVNQWITDTHLIAMTR
ncbi:hypothetical protein [Streptomyces sp. NPDC018693]|uniref:hypothetical protein n=1 Tax=unclassified Streptomyces TaxID=2593676 RepID=UPI00379F8E9A